MCPCEELTRPYFFFFTFFRLIFRQLRLSENMDHLSPFFFSEKKAPPPIPPPSRVRHRDGHVQHACRDIWTFVRKNEQDIRHFLQKLGFSVRSTFFARFYLVLNTARSDLRFLARKIATTDMPWSLGVRPTRSCKTRRNFFFASAGKKPECDGKN